MARRPSDQGPADEIAASRSFWCFISYRHSDNATKGREWATWLHRELETYDVPQELVGTSNEQGLPIPGRIYPVFRDEEELPAYADLSSAILHALSQSRSLIVICSPDAKNSKFVNEEVARFKALGRASRLCGMVIRGDPDVLSAANCLPLPLIRKVGSDGRVSQVAETPLLVDLREAGGGEEWQDSSLRLASLVEAGASPEEASEQSAVREARLQESKLFLIAWVLGVSYQTLYDAHERKERALRRGRYYAVAFWASLAVTGLLAVWFGLQAADGMRQRADESAGKAEMAKLAAQKAQQEIAAKELEAAKIRLGTLFAEGLALRQAERWSAAAAVFRQASDGGHHESRVELAKLLVEGRGVPVDANAAIGLLEEPARAGDAKARVLLGRLLVVRDGDVMGKARGIELLRAALKAGDSNVRLDLAKALLPSRPAEAFVLIKEDALAGAPESCWMFGSMLKAQSGYAAAPAGNLPEWYRWWSKAADGGWIPAKRDVGAAMWGGALGSPAAFGASDRLTALRHLAEAARAGDAPSAERFARLYENPEDRPAHAAEAQEFLQEGANAGVAKAMFGLAELYAEKAADPEDPNFRSALDWFGRSAQAGLLAQSSVRQAELMVRVAAGHPGADNKTLLASALAKYSDAAKSGNVEGMIGAAEVVQVLGGPNSFEQAQDWLSQAESLHSLKAGRLRAALLLKHGKEAREVADILRRGMERGDGEAALMLGDWMISRAQGKEQLAITFETYDRGAILGNSLCALKASAMLRRGQGVPKDLSKAERLELKAAESGDALCMMERGRRLLGAKDEGRLPEAFAWLALASSAGKAKECEPLLATAGLRLGEPGRAAAVELQKRLAKTLGAGSSAGGK